MPWLRLWVDILDDPDLHELPNATCWGWVLILTVVKKVNKDGTLPTVKKLAYMIHEPEETVRKWVAELVAAGLLESNGVTVLVHSWSRWQEPKDETNSARQKKHRKKHLSTTAEALPEKANPEKQRGRRGSNAVTAASNAAVTVPRAYDRVRSESESASVSVSELGESRGGQTAEQTSVCELAAEIGGDVSWSMWASRRLAMGDTPEVLEAALSEGVNSGKMNQNYIGRIAARFAKEGIPEIKSNPNGKVPYKSQAKVYPTVKGPR